MQVGGGRIKPEPPQEVASGWSRGGRVGPEGVALLLGSSSLFTPSLCTLVKTGKERRQRLCSQQTNRKPVHWSGACCSQWVLWVPPSIPLPDRVLQRHPQSGCRRLPQGGLASTKLPGNPTPFPQENATIVSAQTRPVPGQACLRKVISAKP